MQVLALLRLSFPDRPAVFGALSIGCADSLRTVLSRGADPDEKFDGLSPLAYCILSTRNPMALYGRASGIFALRNFTVETATELISALLCAGATPTTEDMRRACFTDTPAIGNLLLGSGLLPTDRASLSPLLIMASEHCPDLVYPLLEHGAELPHVLPPGTRPDVFLEAQWKQVRTLYMLDGRRCLPISKELLAVIAAFLTEPIRLRRNAQDEAEDGAIRCLMPSVPPPRFEDVFRAMPFC